MPGRETVTELPQHREQRFPAQRVDLIEEQHQRLRTPCNPRRQPRAQPITVTRVRPRRRRQELMCQTRLFRLQGDGLEHQILGHAKVVAGHSGRLAGKAQRDVLALLREPQSQLPQARTLTGLARSVHHEILTARDVAPRVGQPLLRGQHVVLAGVTPPNGVEVLHTATVQPPDPPQPR